MPLSLFVLALWVLLVSMSQLLLAWFNFDVKFLGFVGLAFVLAVVLEALWQRRALFAKHS